MQCQICSKKPATVHITEVIELGGTADEPNKLQQKHVCDACAAVMDLPHAPPASKGVVDIWQLLQQSAQRSSQEGGLRCPDCGMTLAEFRSQGRLGCPRDYEIFGAHLEPLLQRIHNATEHQGRLPGVAQEELDRMRSVHELRERLETAIREEEYEDAARLRDELAQIEAKGRS
jgi:protein arginine kinase activator